MQVLVFIFHFLLTFPPIAAYCNVDCTYYWNNLAKYCIELGIYFTTKCCDAQSNLLNCYYSQCVACGLTYCLNADNFAYMTSFHCGDTPCIEYVYSSDKLYYEGCDHSNLCSCHENLKDECGNKKRCSCPALETHLKCIEPEVQSCGNSALNEYYAELEGYAVTDCERYKCRRKKAKAEKK